MEKIETLRLKTLKVSPKLMESQSTHIKLHSTTLSQHKPTITKVTSCYSHEATVVTPGNRSPVQPRHTVPLKAYSMCAMRAASCTCEGVA
jgi:hypothetical protein